MDLLTVGDAFEDMVFAGLPRLPRLSEELRVESLSTHPGGGAIITAIGARRLGVRTATITAVSDNIRHALGHERVSLVNLKRADESAAVTVALSTSRDRAFVTYEGVNRVLEPRLLDAVRRLPRAPKHVHFAFVPRRCRAWLPVLATLRRRGITTSWDFGWHEQLRRDAAFPTLLAALDWLFVNEREAMLYTRTQSMPAATAAWHSTARAAVVKRGPKGALIIVSGNEWRVPTTAVRVVDTTGAGDAFNAGFLTAWLAGTSVTHAGRLGNHVGGRSVRAAGGIDGLPRREQLPGWARRLLDRP